MGTCRMSAGSGAIGRSLNWIQAARSAKGLYAVAATGLVTFGREQHEQKWQFGAQSPPETSVGQRSSQSTSPQSADNPLTLKVSRARNATNTAFCTSAVFHTTSGDV